MATAQRTLTDALTKAQEAYDASIKAISDSTNKQLDALMAKIDAAAAKIRSLAGTVPTPSFSTVGPTTAPAVGQVYTPSQGIASAASLGLADAQKGITSYGSGVDTSTLAGIAKASGTTINLNQTNVINSQTTADDIANATITRIKYGMAVL